MTNPKQRLIGGGAMIAASLFFMHELLGWVLQKIFDWFAQQSWEAVFAWPWMTMLGILIFTIGLGFVLTSLRTTAPPLPPTVSWSDILEDAKSQIDEISYIRGADYPAQNTSLRQMRMAAAGCLMSIAKQDFVIPQIPEEDWRALLMFEAYGSPMVEMVRRGHLDEAKSLSAELAKNAETYANAASSNEFFRN